MMQAKVTNVRVYIKLILILPKNCVFIEQKIGFCGLQHKKVNLHLIKYPFDFRPLRKAFVEAKELVVSEFFYAYRIVFC